MPPLNTPSRTTTSKIDAPVATPVATVPAPTGPDEDGTLNAVLSGDDPNVRQAVAAMTAADLPDGKSLAPAKDPNQPIEIIVLQSLTSPPRVGNFDFSAVYPGVAFVNGQRFIGVPWHVASVLADKKIVAAISQLPSNNRALAPAVPKI